MTTVTTMTEKTHIAHAIEMGYTITPTGDGCGEVLTPDGVAYHIHDWACDCADATYREGGSYELPDGQRACKHVLWLAQASRPEYQIHIAPVLAPASARVKIITIGLVEDAPIPEVTATDPAVVADLLKTERHADREHFVCFHLDARNQIVSKETVSVGSLNASLVHPREVFKAAVLSSAAKIILAHNHPSGDPSPSREDIELTRRLVDAGEIMGIEVLDHIIVAHGCFLSMKEAALF